MVAESVPYSFVGGKDFPRDVRTLPTGRWSSDYSEVEIRFVWNSQNTTLAKDKNAPMVRWGLSPTTLNNTVLGNTSTYTREDFCSAPANAWGYRDTGAINAVAVLLPVDSTVWYSYGKSGEGSIESAVRQFDSPPPPSGTENNRSTRVVLFGDLGIGPLPGDDGLTWEAQGRDPAAVNTSFNVQREVEMMKKDDEAGRSSIDAVLHIGDISYAEGFASVWGEYLSMVTAWAGRVTYMVNQGNHEYDSFLADAHDGEDAIWDTNDSGGECGVAVTNQLPMPSRENAGHDWYSYDIGLIHFTVMNTEVNFSRGSEQYNWIKQDLENVNRSNTPWIVFAGHRPAYVNSEVVRFFLSPAPHARFSS